MKLPSSAHTSRPWRIHEIAHDFELEDVWELPTPGGPDDFIGLVEIVASGDPSQGGSAPVRALFALREKLGELLGWDDPDGGLGARVPTLRDRLPDDLRDAPAGPEPAHPFSPLFSTGDEWAAEIANRTMHGVLHLGWVRDETGDGYHGQLAVLVKRNGLLGTAYMAAIWPFRHLIVYPAMVRNIGRRWARRPRGVPAAA